MLHGRPSERLSESPREAFGMAFGMSFGRPSEAPGKYVGPAQVTASLRMASGRLTESCREAFGKAFGDLPKLQANISSSCLCKAPEGLHKFVTNHLEGFPSTFRRFAKVASIVH